MHIPSQCDKKKFIVLYSVLHYQSYSEMINCHKLSFSKLLGGTIFPSRNFANYPLSRNFKMFQGFKK